MTTIAVSFETKIADTITAIESDPGFLLNRFQSANYPHIYACYYVRAHKDALGITGWPNATMNLAEAANWLEYQAPSDEEHLAVCHRLADSYIRENNITPVVCEWCQEPLGRAFGLWVTSTRRNDCMSTDSPNRAHKPQDVRDI